MPRFSFTDFPLGNPIGKPGDAQTQLANTRLALSMLHEATQPRTSAQTPFVWSEDDHWRGVYSRVDDSNRAELARVGDARRQSRAQLPKRT